MPQTLPSSHAVVTAYFDALARGDLPALRASFAPDATWRLSGDLPASGTYTGPDAIIDDFLARMFARLDPEAQVSQDVHAIVAGDGAAVVEWTTYATARGGEPYVNDYCAVFEIEDGRIIAVREYSDTARMASVLF